MLNLRDLQPAAEQQYTGARHARFNWLPVVLILAGVTVFVLDAWAVKQPRFDSFDLSIHRHIVSAVGPDMARRLTSITMARHTRTSRPWALAVLVLAAATAVWLFLRSRPWSVVAGAIAVPGAFIVEFLLKSNLTRNGPMLSPGNVGLRTFPSGHATIGITACVVAGYLLSRDVSAPWRVALWLLTGIASAAVVASTLMFHFPSEVLAGTITACLWVTAAMWLMRPFLKREEWCSRRHRLT